LFIFSLWVHNLQFLKNFPCIKGFCEGQIILKIAKGKNFHSINQDTINIQKEFYLNYQIIFEKYILGIQADLEKTERMRVTTLSF
jgi:hypothetical protein